MLLFPTEACWSSLNSSMLLNQILVFKNALAFMLKKDLFVSHNAKVKHLLETLKLLYQVSIMSLLMSSVIMFL